MKPFPTFEHMFFAMSGLVCAKRLLFRSFCAWHLMKGLAGFSVNRRHGASKHAEFLVKGRTVNTEHSFKQKP